MLSWGLNTKFRVEATGFAGGIWLLWNESSSVELPKVHPQFIHARIHNWKCRRPFLCTVVYASPQPGLRSQLWSQLDLIASKVNEPWLLSGDFNVIMCADERQGGVVTSKIGCSLFKNFFFQNGFLDLGFQGPKFTWSRGQLFQRLDQSFCNGEWQNFAPNTLVRHLYKFKFDHRPLMVFMNPERIDRGT